MAQYVLDPETVQDCMWDLVDARVHRHYPGYLCVKRLANRDGHSRDLDFEYDAFFNLFFKVRDYADPYFVPFGQRHTQVADLWFNENVAGTYSAQSIRPDQPFDRVVDVEKVNNQNKASLRDQHWEKAREHLTGSDKVPVTALTGFLYRDFALEFDSTPEGEDLVRVFREEFGYDPGDSSETEEFEHLYTMDDIEVGNEDFTQV
jgi:hypothetical protein